MRIFRHYATHFYRVVKNNRRLSFFGDFFRNLQIYLPNFQINQKIIGKKSENLNLLGVIAYTRSMNQIKISDSEIEEGGVYYIANSLHSLVEEFGGNTVIEKKADRIIAKIYCKSTYLDLFKSEIEDKVADVLAIKYKYEFFKRRICPIGLNAYQSEILYTALISADIEDDKRYIIRKIRGLDGYVIDGIYTLLLPPLKNKWQEIVSYIPLFFDGAKLCDFVSFLVSEKRGKRVIVDGKDVYDGNYNRLKRSSLLDGEGDVLREVLLSASGNVDVLSTLPEETVGYLKSFFGGRITFLKGSLQKTVDKNF